MTALRYPILSMVMPLFNESAGIVSFHSKLSKTIKAAADSYEVIYRDDSSNVSPVDS